MCESTTTTTFRSTGQETKLDEFMEMLDQRVASHEQDARQAEGQAMHGDSCSANRVDPDPMCSKTQAAL